MNNDTCVSDILHRVLRRVYNMRIAVCDDEQLFQESVKDAVYSYSNMHRFEITVDCFDSGEELLDSKNEYNMLLLDYKMGGIDGLETARALRKRNQDCKIIFITSYTHFVIRSFEVDTFRFIVKPLDIQELYKVLDVYFESFGNDYPLHIKVNRENIFVKPNEIFFLEADNKKCYVNLAKKQLHCAKTMAAVATHLPQNIFFKVHKAYIVNFNHVSGHDNEYVYLKNGSKVHTSRKYLASFKKDYKSYLKGKVF